MRFQRTLLGAIFAAVGAGFEKLPSEVEVLDVFKKAEIVGRVVRDEKTTGRPVIALHFGHVMQFTDKHTPLLRAFPELRTLQLYRCCLQDAGLKEIATLPNLESLEIGSPVLTDAGVAHLVAAKKLKSLQLHGPVTDAGVKSIARMKNLEHVAINSNKVTDAGMKHLAGMPNLVVVDVHETLVTAIGVAELLKAKTLLRLHLDRIRVDDVVASVLAERNKIYLLDLASGDWGPNASDSTITRLDLIGTSLTHKGFGKLRGLANLETLDLTGRPLTKQIVEELGK